MKKQIGKQIGKQIVKIIEYKPDRGRGKYMTPRGDIVKFRYTAFHNEAAIWPGKKAVLKDGFLYPAKISDNINWTLRRVLKWR